MFVDLLSAFFHSRWTARAHREVPEMAIWVLEEQDGPVQGTAFAAEGADLVSCGTRLPGRADVSRLRCNL